MKHRERFLHLQLALRELPIWARLVVLFRGRLHLLLHRNGQGQYRVASVTLTDPTKGKADA